MSAESYSYDPASQVTQILHQLTATSTQINKADSLYNGVGNRTTGKSVVNVEMADNRVGTRPR